MSIPASKSETAFQRYANYIGRALREYPKPVRFDLHGQSVETFAARFRDARAGKVLYGYQSPIVDEALFHAHAADLTVAMRSGYVLVGTKDAIRNYEMAETVRPHDSGQAELFVDFSDMACAIHLCELIKHKAFGTQPIAFTVGPLTEEFAKKLESDYGVTLVADLNRPLIYTLL